MMKPNAQCPTASALLPRAMRLVRLPEVQKRVGLGRSTIYRRIGEGTFPKPKSLGGGLIGWLESDIDAWIDERIAHRAQP